MNLLARLAALEHRRPRAAPPDDDGPRRYALQLRRDWSPEQQREALQLIVDEVHGYVCADHPVAIILSGERAPAPVRCAACHSWNVIAAPAPPPERTP